MWHHRHKSHNMKFLLDLSLRLLIETLTGDFEKLKWILITLPTVELLSDKNARAWVSIVSYLKKQMKIKILK